MSGYPELPTRSAFGPEMQNARPVINPTTDLGADSMNLSYWQIAGASRVLPQAVILFDPTGPTVIFQSLAFDPRQVLADIPVVVNGTGDYTFTFQSTYLNEQGIATPFQPVAVAPFPQTPTVGFSAVGVILTNAVQVATFNAAHAAADATVLVAVW